jgi:TolA-binding protein
MSFRHLLLTGAIALPTLLLRPTEPPRGVAAQTVAAAQSARSDEGAAFASEPPVSWDDADPADSLYRQARELLNRGEYQRSAAVFRQITMRYPKSTYAPDALYWRAFALYRSGSESDLRDALKDLATQRSQYPKAKTTGDASALEVRIHGALAQRGDEASARRVSSSASSATSQASSCSSSDDREDESDVRAAALNALLQMDAERALPIIKQVLARRDACSVPLRRKAVFLLSQKQTSESESLLLDVVRRDPSQRVREEAVFWMGQLHSESAAAALEDIALRSSDEALREKAVFSLGQQNLARGQAVVRRLAEADDTPPRVREKAIFQLGQNRSQENAQFLRDLFNRMSKTERTEDTRKHILFSLSQMQGVGNDRWLLGVAGDASQSTDVRKHALWTAGQAGVSASEFIPLYDRSTDRAIKEQLIWVLSESRDRAAADKLIDIARNDRDPELRKKAIFWLGQMHDPRIQQLLLDIINKG